MDFSKKQLSIFYVEGVRAFYYNSQLTSLLQINFTPDSFNNLEVTNKKNLENLFKNFLETNKIPNGNNLIILAPQVTFEKEYPPIENGDDKMISDFLELVPFEYVLSRFYKLNGIVKVVAVN